MSQDIQPGESSSQPSIAAQAPPLHLRRPVKRNGQLGAPRLFPAILLKLLDSKGSGVEFCCAEKHGIALNKTDEQNTLIRSLNKTYGDNANNLTNFIRQCELYLDVAAICDVGGCIRKAYTNLRPDYVAFDLLFRFRDSISLTQHGGISAFLAQKPLTIKPSSNSGKALLVRQAQKVQNEVQVGSSSSTKTSQAAKPAIESDKGKGKSKFNVWQDGVSSPADTHRKESDGVPASPNSSGLSDPPPLSEPPTAPKKKIKKRKKVENNNNYRRRLEEVYDAKRAAENNDEAAWILEGSQVVPAHVLPQFETPPAIRPEQEAMTEEEAARRLSLVDGYTPVSTSAGGSSAGKNVIPAQTQHDARGTRVSALAYPTFLPTLSALGDSRQMYDDTLDAAGSSTAVIDDYDDYRNPVNDAAVDAIWGDFMYNQRAETQVVTRQQRRQSLDMGDTDLQPLYSL